MGVYIVVPAKRGRSQDTARQARRMHWQNESRARVWGGKKMLVLPIIRSVAQVRFREGGGKVEGSREWA